MLKKILTELNQKAGLLLLSSSRVDKKIALQLFIFFLSNK